MTKAIVEVAGGNAAVTAGHAVIVDWDNIQEDREYAEAILELLKPLRSRRAAVLRCEIGKWAPEARYTGDIGEFANDTDTDDDYEEVQTP